MDLTVDYIRERHRYWRYRIADEGIWDVIKFEPVEFEVRPRSKTYNALFLRKIIRRKPFDRIIIYRNSPDMSVRHVDSMIVHETIHQYIIQNNLHDTSTHGLLFKAFMNNINKAFPEELDIQICSESPIMRGAGDKMYKILVVKFPDRYIFCNVRPSKVQHFTNYAIRKGWKYMWGESNDLYFDELNLCTKRLQGFAVKPNDMEAFERDSGKSCLTILPEEDITEVFSRLENIPDEPDEDRKYYPEYKVRKCQSFVMPTFEDAQRLIHSETLSKGDYRPVYCIRIYELPFGKDMIHDLSKRQWVCDRDCNLVNQSVCSSLIEDLDKPEGHFWGNETYGPYPSFSTWETPPILSVRSKKRHDWMSIVVHETSTFVTYNRSQAQTHCHIFG